MTPKVFRSVAKYIVRTASDYGLRDWQLHIHEGVDDESHAAEVSCLYGRRLANLQVRPDFPTWTPEEQRAVVLHELTHVHLDQVTTLVQSALPELIGKPAFEAFMAGYTQAMEHATDAIATAIADRYELWEG